MEEVVLHGQLAVIGEQSELGKTSAATHAVDDGKHTKNSRIGALLNQGLDHILALGVEVVVPVTQFDLTLPGLRPRWGNGCLSNATCGPFVCLRNYRLNKLFRSHDIPFL